MKLISLREARLKRRWTQERLAAESGVNQGRISRLETGSGSNPTLETIEKLATALGVPIGRLQFKPGASTAVSDEQDSTVSPSSKEAQGGR